MFPNSRQTPSLRHPLLWEIPSQPQKTDYFLLCCVFLWTCSWALVSHNCSYLIGCLLETAWDSPPFSSFFSSFLHDKNYLEAFVKYWYHPHSPSRSWLCGSGLLLSNLLTQQTFQVIFIKKERQGIAAHNIINRYNWENKKLQDEQSFLVKINDPMDTVVQNSVEKVRMVSHYTS